MGNLRWIFFYCLLLPAVVAQVPNLELSPAANYMAIDGWWSQCGSLNNALKGEGCIGNLESVELTPIDASGDTCYINPRTLATQDVEHMIYWFHNAGFTSSITVYSWYMPYSDLATYFPTECTEGGACRCGIAFEEVRAGWNSSANSAHPCKGSQAVKTPITHECRALSFQPLEHFLQETPCAVVPYFSRRYVETFYGTWRNHSSYIYACAIPASFVSYQPTPIATATTTSASANTKSILSIVMPITLLLVLLVR